MVEFAIPEQYERGFVEILRLDENQAHGLVSALEDAPPTRNLTDLQRVTEEKMDQALPSDLNEIMETLSSLYGLRDNTGLDLPEFTEVISEMVEESHAEGLEFTNEKDRERFKATMAQLLGVDSLAIAARASDILYERERTIHGTPRIFTDIRPIFGANAEADPRGAIIVHTLKVRYHDGRQVQELFLGLDTENVNEFIGVLERANSKAEALKRFLGDKGVMYIDAT